ncbi:MAG: response regulator transcription factor [Lysobacterales bacterium]|nr:MAG: response regulator transcription factor [Xanthomonadales bacterium]
MIKSETQLDCETREAQEAHPRKNLKILVVDDHPVVRYGLVERLRAEPDFTVVDEAASCAECCEKLRSMRPDVVVLDLEMGDATGLEALLRLREIDPDVPTIVYTAHGADSRVVEAIRVGVQGYLMKKSPIDIVFEAIRIVSAGGSFLDPEVTSKVMGALVAGRERSGTAARELTEREKSVLQMLAQGKRNKEISQALSISERTVKFHISSVLGKLQATNRTEAVVVAAEQGLIRF